MTLLIDKAGPVVTYSRMFAAVRWSCGRLIQADSAINGWTARIPLEEGPEVSGFSTLGVVTPRVVFTLNSCFVSGGKILQSFSLRML